MPHFVPSRVGTPRVGSRWVSPLGDVFVVDEGGSRTCWIRCPDKDNMAGVILTSDLLTWQPAPPPVVF